MAEIKHADWLLNVIWRFMTNKSVTIQYTIAMLLENLFMTSASWGISNQYNFKSFLTLSQLNVFDFALFEALQSWRLELWLAIEVFCHLVPVQPRKLPLPSFMSERPGQPSQPGPGFKLFFFLRAQNEFERTFDPKQFWFWEMSNFFLTNIAAQVTLSTSLPPMSVPR